MEERQARAGAYRSIRAIGLIPLQGGPADQIEAHTRRVLERHAEREFTAETWRKIALTEEQVRRSPRLRKEEITKFDNRYKPPKAYQAVECEALKQAPLIAIIRKQFDKLLPEPIDRVLVREQRQRRRVAALLRTKE
jgi:hypothetical protein